MGNSTYWEKRVANKTWDIYNTLEERNKALMEIYQEASLDIEEELFQIAKKIKTSTPTLSDMHKYNRLGKLKDNINDTIKQLGKEIEKQATKQITQAFLDNYENTIKELGSLEYSLPNNKLIESLLKFPWSGENFSNRLWENTRVLANNLNEILTRGLVQGKTIVEMATELDSRMMKGFNEAHRLVRTETMHYLNESSLRAYIDSGVKEVQLWAAIDERTCPVCGVKHGNKYRLKDAPVLPLHANCRCTYLPVVDIDEEKEVMSRKKNNVGDFKHLKEPMQLKHIKRVAKKANIDLNGIKIKIQRDKELINAPFAGSAAPEQIGRIDLFPGAFIDREQLLRTLVHEKVHVGQYKKYGSEYVMNNSEIFEKEAYKIEKEWYNNYKMKGGKKD